MEAVRPAEAGDLPRCAELVAEGLRAIEAARGGRLLATLGTGAATTGPEPPTGAPPDPHRLVHAWAGGIPGGAGAGAGGGAHDGTGTGSTARAAGSSRLLVGTLDGVVVGLAAGTIAGGEGATGRIECCYVEEEARGVGVGNALVIGLLDWFDGCGCPDVDALALPGDRSTKQLLEATGFKTRLLVLHRSPS